MGEGARRQPLARLVAAWKTIAFVLAGVVLVNVALHATVVRRMVTLSGDREAILDRRSEELAAATAEVRALERTVSKIACSRADVRHVFEDLLSSKTERLTAILREIRQLATSHRMDPSRLAFNWTPVRGSDLVRFDISFPLTAPYGTLREFVKQVESSENFLLIEDITLNEQRAEGRNLRFQVTIVTFFRDPDLGRLREVFGGRRR